MQSAWVREELITRDNVPVRWIFVVQNYGVQSWASNRMSDLPPTESDQFITAATRRWRVQRAAREPPSINTASSETSNTAREQPAVQRIPTQSVHRRLK